VRTVLSPEVSAFLVQFSIYIHQHGSYPANHPVLTSAASATVFRLNTLLLDRETFAVRVAGDRLLIDGTFTDPNHAVLRDLARQLHRQQLGAVRFWRGVGPHELEDLVEEIAAARRAEKPLGLETEQFQQRWAHIRLDGQTYDQLRLADDAEGGIGFSPEARLSEAGTTQRLWMALAAAALVGDAEVEPGVDAAQVAQAIAKRREDAKYDRVIVDYLLQLGREIPRAPAGEVTPLTARFNELLGALDAETLERLLVLGSTLEQREELISMVNRDLPVNTVVMILQAAANAGRQTMSHTLLRMLNKLALQGTSDGPERVRAEADIAVRETVRRLLDDWTLENPNPLAHTGLLDRMAEGRLGQARELPQEQAALRIVQMSLEIGVVGGMLRDAINDLLDRGEVRTLMELLRESTPSAAVEAIWNHLATPTALEILLQHDDLDAEAVEELISRLGPRAAVPMLEALIVAESRSVRRRLVTWLRRIGADIGPLIVERLPNAAWYVQRNLLGLLGTLPTLPPGFSPMPYTTHSDARVRREALKLAWNSDELYDEAVQHAIRDLDPQIVSIGLTIALERFPSGAGSAVLAVARRREWPSEIRVQAIRALTHVKTTPARSCLIELAMAKRRWFRAPRLVQRSPELLAVIAVLATTWPDDAAAREVVRLATQSRDEVVRMAVRPGGAE
jgi:hypothetical protein